jgi:Tol biopolymer transport system component
MKRAVTIIAIVAAAVAALSLAASSGAQPGASGPTLSKIAFFSYDVRDKGMDVNILNADGTGQWNVTHDGTAVRNVDPNWSLNGAQIAFTRYWSNGGSDIMVIGANGKGLVNVTGPALQPGIMNVHPTFAPNGSIVFASNRDGNFDLYRIGPSSIGTRTIVRMTKTEAPVQNLDPDYSADGLRLVFSRQSSVAPTTKTGAALFLMRATPGAKALRLTSATTGADLYVLTLGQLGFTRLTWSKNAEREPSWSPDGASLVYLDNQTGYTELWVLPLQGMNPGPPQPWQLTFCKLTKGAPDWQPALPTLNG